MTGVFEMLRFDRNYGATLNEALVLQDKGSFFSYEYDESKFTQRLVWIAIFGAFFAMLAKILTSKPDAVL